MTIVTKIGRGCVFEVETKKGPVHDVLFFTVKAPNGEVLTDVRCFKYGEVVSVDHHGVDEKLPRGMRRWLAKRVYSLAGDYLKKRGLKLIHLRTHKYLGKFLIRNLGYRKVFETPIGMDVEKNLGQRARRKPVKKTPPRRLRRR